MSKKFPPIPPIDLDQIERDLKWLMDHKVKYGLGAKAPAKYFEDPNLPLSVKDIPEIDCSGFYRLAIFRATKGKLLLPDGSWNQRAWCLERAEAGLLHRITNYADINRYMTKNRMFACFIVPNKNGAGDVGHIWLTGEIDGDRAADTLESHGGKGPDSRDWDARTLKREFYDGFELPILKRTK